MKRSTGIVWGVATAWLILLGGYILAVLLLPAGNARNAFIHIYLCTLPLVVNAALLVNAISTDWRKNAFWMLLALGCSLWLAGQAYWSYVEIYKLQPVQYPFIGHFIFFLHVVPMIAVLTMRPDKSSANQTMLYGHVDFGLMLCWWVYLYVFLVLPWQLVVVDRVRYLHAHDAVSALENIVFIGGAAILATGTRGRWRIIYANLACAGVVYTAGLLLVNLLVERTIYSRASLYNFTLPMSYIWLGSVGVFAHATRGEESESSEPAVAEKFVNGMPASESVWAARMARTVLLSLPVIGFWSVMMSHAPEAVRTFRLLVTLGAVLPMGFLAFLRHELIDSERLRLLRTSQESLDNLKRLQTQFVQSEKLASLGQLVGGAAHEINNPLTAILGYSEMLADNPAVDGSARDVAEKIRDQARRTKTLVNNLLSFARQAPSEQLTSLDINTIVNSSIQFRRVDLRGKNIRIDVQTALSLPEVRGDANHLLQIFFNIINNAVDAMHEVGGGTLTVRTFFEKGSVVILFSDTGPGIEDPQLVFDPFYTTKPVGKGTGLGLSICYGLVQDQGGKISCENRPEGGATFRLEFPAVLAALPQRITNSGSRNTPTKLA